MKKVIIYTNTGNFIKNLRGKELQTSFAEKLKVSQPLLSRYESGRSKPSVELIIGIVNCYGFDALKGLIENFEKDGRNE